MLPDDAKSFWDFLAVEILPIGYRTLLFRTCDCSREQLGVSLRSKSISYCIHLSLVLVTSAAETGLTRRIMYRRTNGRLWSECFRGSAPLHSSAETSPLASSPLLPPSKFSLPLSLHVSASVAAIVTVYMRVLLSESMADEIRRNTKEEEVSISLLDEDRNSRKNQVRVFKTMPSFDDTVSLLRSSLSCLFRTMDGLIQKVWNHLSTTEVIVKSLALSYPGRHAEVIGRQVPLMDEIDDKAQIQCGDSRSNWIHPCYCICRKGRTAF